MIFPSIDEGQGKVHQGGQKEEGHCPQVNRTRQEGEGTLRLLQQIKCSVISGNIFYFRNDNVIERSCSSIFVDMYKITQNILLTWVFICPSGFIQFTVEDYDLKPIVCTQINQARLQQIQIQLSAGINVMSCIVIFVVQ